MPFTLWYVCQWFGGTFECKSNNNISPTQNFESPKHGQISQRWKNFALHTQKQKCEWGDVGGNKLAFLKVFSEK